MNVKAHFFCLDVPSSIHHMAADNDMMLTIFQRQIMQVSLGL
jgi:hypothetical protein